MTSEQYEVIAALMFGVEQAKELGILMTRKCVDRDTGMPFSTFTIDLPGFKLTGEVEYQLMNELQQYAEMLEKRRD